MNDNVKKKPGRPRVNIPEVKNEVSNSTEPSSEIKLANNTDVETGINNINIIPSKDTGIKFFGGIDIDEKGKNKNDYPAWHFKQNLNILKEDVRKAEGALEHGLVPQAQIRQAQQDLAMKKNRVEQIECSRPKVEGTQKDNVVKAINNLGEKIGETMPSRSDVKRGLGDPQEEYRCNTEPCIPVKDEVTANFIKKYGIKMQDGKINRNDAGRIRQILCSSIGAKTNLEHLRRD